MTLPLSVELTKLTKHGGPLTKQISLNADGSVLSDGSACVMVRGRAQRVRLGSMQELAELIETLTSFEAIALGTLRPDLADNVKVVTKEKIAELNGVARSDIIARTSANIVYAAGEPALVLLDYDRKGMPPHVAIQLKRRGDFWKALVSVLPELADAARVTRLSTSAGLYRSDTDKPLPESGGMHVFVVIEDGRDAERFLKTLHDRCWLAGLGWMMVSTSGALLERSIVDSMVFAPERLVFEGPPILAPPLEQDQKRRRPVAVSGEILKSAVACPPLTIVERVKLEKLKAEEKQRLAPEARKSRNVFIERQAADIVKRTGKSKDEAKRIVERWNEGVLHSDVVLPFDDPKLAGKTVGDVLADPGAFEDETLADPLEGVEYGRCKAKIFLCDDGTPWINSFAHGRTIYELKHDAASVRKALEAAAKNDVVATFVRLAVAADLDAIELEDLRQLAKKLCGTGLRVIDGALKAARQKQAAQEAQAARDRRAAQRRDPRLFIRAPFPDEPWLPEMEVLNDVIGKVTAATPPSRDIDDDAMRVRKLPVPNMHAFTPSEANVEPEETTND